MGVRVDKSTLEIAIKAHRENDELPKLDKELKDAQNSYHILEKRRDKLLEKQKEGKVLTIAECKELASLNAEIEEQGKKYKELDQRKTEYLNKGGFEKMTIRELTAEYNRYKTILNNLTPDNSQYEATKQYMQGLKDRMAELRDTAEKTHESLGKFGGGFLGKIFGAENDFKGIKTLFTGNLLVKGASMVFDTITEYAGKAFNRVKELVTESVQAARAAQGISHAFKQIDQPGLLDGLRKATHGTVTDLELMKAAVQAKDFRLPLDQLGKYLEFAQLKAQQTGQSVDYMTNSIVTGLGRKSVMILDNLGISASEIKEEMAQTGDMATAVGNIIDKQLAQAGEHFETAAEREQQATTDVANAQLKLGQQMQKTFGIGNTSFSEMQAKAETFILNGLTKMIVYCQSLYDKMGTVRIVVEGVKVAFDTVFKVCEFGFSELINIVKLVARLFRDFGSLVEGAFTGNVDKVKNAWDSLQSGMKKSVKEIINDAKDIGTRWGKNVVDSINNVTGNSKVESPEVQPPKLPTTEPKKTKEDDPKPHKDKITPSDNISDNYQRDLAAREQAYEDYGNQLKKMLLNQLLTQQEYEEESRLSEKKFLADKIALQQLYGQDSTQTQGQFLDLLLKEADGKYKESKQQLQNSLSQADAAHNAQIKQLMEQQLKGELDSEKTYNELKLQADIDYQRRRLEILKAAGADTAQAEQQLLQLQLQQHKQAEQEQTQTLNDEAQKRQQIQEAAFNAVNGLLSSAGSLFSALQQRETSQVDKKYKKQIEAAKKAGKDTTKLEEQMEAEKAEIQKKYAQKQFKLQILQIIAATAQSIANIWREWAWNPTWAGILTGIAAAQGAIQLATAKAQADAAAGLYEGGYSEGYTEKGNPRDQAGVIPVHKNEFVANHKAVANSQIRPVLDVIDRHQKAGDIQMLNATQMLEEAYGRGRYRGGYSSSNEEGGMSNENTMILSTPETLQLLRRIADATEDSLTVRELRREIKHQERLEANAGR